MYSPVSGTVVETNAALNDTPALVRPHLRARGAPSRSFGAHSCADSYRFDSQVNQSPFGDAWIMKVKLSNPAGAHKKKKRRLIFGSFCAHFALSFC